MTNISVGFWTFSILTTTVFQRVVRLSPLFTNSLVRLRACGLKTLSWLWQFSAIHNLNLCHVLYHKLHMSVGILSKHDTCNKVWHPAGYRWCRLYTHLPQFIGRWDRHFYFGLAHTTPPPPLKLFSWILLFAQLAEQVQKYWHSVLKRLIGTTQVSCERGLAFRGEDRK